MKPAPFSALIIAGGQSSRMGQDKAFLNYQGHSLLARTHALAEQAGAREVLISHNAPGFIADNYPLQGPLAGLEAGLRHCQYPQVLLLAIDMPCLTVTELQTLLQHGPGHYQQQPFPALIEPSPQLMTELERRLLDTQAPKSLQSLWQWLALPSLAIQRTEAFLNTNDPASWQQLLAQSE